MSRAVEIPVVLFAYARPGHLARVLACLRENRVPLIHAFADGAKGPGDAAGVAKVRTLLRAVDWCEMHLVERPGNFGLGRNVLAGVEEVAARHEAFIVWEDDLICVPGTYAWMCAALRHYADDPRVMSVSAWTHPRVTPEDVGERSYFDGRAEAWSWGTYARSWHGMSGETAWEKLLKAEEAGRSCDSFGSDMPRMAREETARNIWAVRWFYHHLQQGGLCLRPPWSMVEHIGIDNMATNAAGSNEWNNPVLRTVPVGGWPVTEINFQCGPLWRRAFPPGWRRRWLLLARRLAPGPHIMKLSIFKKYLRPYVPVPLRRAKRALFGWRWFRGRYRTWNEAQRHATGYDQPSILEKVLHATLEVKAGRAAYERDSCVFKEREIEKGLIEALQEIAADNEGRLRIIDFGGSLGSSYWQHRPELDAFREVRWDVVEQRHFVESGRRFLQDGRLSFYMTIEEAEQALAHQVLLASGVVHCLPEPHGFLSNLIKHRFRWLVFHNVPLHDDESDYVMIEHVPPEIYRATYPVWFLNRSRFMAHFAQDYLVVRQYASTAIWNRGWWDYPSTGLVMKIKE